MLPNRSPHFALAVRGQWVVDSVCSRTQQMIEQVCFGQCSDDVPSMGISAGVNPTDGSVPFQWLNFGDGQMVHVDVSLA